MFMIKKTLLIQMILLNILVLMGQVIPEAAPPFARIVNIVFLIASLLFFLFYLLKKK